MRLFVLFDVIFKPTIKCYVLGYKMNNDSLQNLLSMYILFNFGRPSRPIILQDLLLDRCLRHRGGEPDQAPEFHAGAYFV